MNEYIDKIIEHAANIFGVDAASLNENSTWKEDLHLDVSKSLQDRNFVDFKAALEDEFEVEIPNIKFGKTKNILEMAEFIRELAEE